MKYQLFSERCSGSNFAEALLSENLPNLESSVEYGFKHWLTKQFLEERDFAPNMIFILVNRNPFDWLRSIHRQPWHCEHSLRTKNFSSFIRSEWQCVWDEQAHIKKEDPRWMKEMEFERNPLDNFARFKNILEVRKVKYSIWGNQLSRHPRTFKIRYEDISKSPAPILNVLANSMGEQEPDTVKIPKGYKGSLSWKRKLALALSLGLVGGYKPNMREPIALEDLDFMMCNLDREQEMDWGYDIESLLAKEQAFTKEHNTITTKNLLLTREL